MNKITLKLYEIYGLQLELTGISVQDKKTSPGLLDEKLSLVTKYWLSNLNESLLKHIQSSEKLKGELIKKYGVEVEGGVSIFPTIEVDDEVTGLVSTIQNPDFITFTNEFNQLIQEEIEIEFHEFKLSEFNEVSSTSTYNVFYRLITFPTE